MVAILGFNRDQILNAVRDMYTEVALDPQRVFHFPTGRAACLFVGYPEDWLDTLPATAVESFAGVGFPFRADVIRPGDHVLDVGAGSGTDVLSAAKLVGSEGVVFALDMTSAMLDKLRRNIERARVGNVRVLEGNAEAIPLPDETIDVVTSNGVLNLVPNKARAFAEMYRVLRPGGGAQIADIVVEKPVGGKLARKSQALGRMRRRRVDRGKLPGVVPVSGFQRRDRPAQLRLFLGQFEFGYPAGRGCARRQGD